MSKYEAIVALFSMATGGAMFMVLVTSWFRYREKSLAARTGGGSTLPQDQRLARIEAAIETVAIEVERISEAQRFTTRLLTERAALTASAARQEETQHVR
jgi:hypothetical protein